MLKKKVLIKAFMKQGGILKTKELKALGLTSRQLKTLLDEGVVSKIKYGYYELADRVVPDQVMIARLFPQAIVFLESALLHYGYTDRIPSAWQIAVDKHSEKSKYDLEYPHIKPFYLEPKFLEFGDSSFNMDGIKIRIFDRDRTLCDVMRYEKKLEREVYAQAVVKYINDPQKNIRRLFEYAKKMNITKKAQSHIGKWLV